MAHQLELLHRRRTKLRVSIEMIAVPLLGLLVLIQVESLRSPLSEAEAPLALAVRHLEQPIPEQASAVATIAASIGPTLITPNEFGMRAFGVIVGCAALGILVWLGARLFSIRTGAIAGIILIATPLGRSFLGTQFGPEPFYLLLFLAALSAIRNLAIDKRSLIRASIIGGTAIALVGPAALWIPGMTIAWLRKLRGLTWNTFGITVGVTLAAAVLISVLAALALGAPVSFSIQIPPIPTTIQMLLFAGLECLPFVPIVLLGLRSAPRHWRYHGSPRFLFLWTSFAAGTFLLFGSISALWVAFALAAGLTTNWALARAEPSYRWAAIGVGVVLGISLGAFAPSGGKFDVDRWAVREAGKFVRRNLSPDAAIGAAKPARGRLSYYGSRAISPLSTSSDKLQGLDYVFVERGGVEHAASSAGAVPDPPPREVVLYGHRLSIIAEFGSWMLARVEPA